MTPDSERAFDRGPICSYECIDPLMHTWQCRSCGHIIHFEADGPYENSVDFCPHCGRLLRNLPDHVEDDE